MKQVKPCKCGQKAGWFEKRVHYGEQYFDENGNASHWVDTNSRGGLRAYCSECGRDITNLIVE